MEIYTDALTFFFLLYCLLYNAFLFFYVVVKYRHRTTLIYPDLTLGPFSKGKGSRGKVTLPLQIGEGLGERSDDWPVLTLMIPGLNEGKVLRKTIESLLEQYYPGTLEVLIIDDASDDDTPTVTTAIQREFSDVYVYRRERPDARQGKGAALNAGLRFLFERFPDRPKEDWVIGIFDADGRLEELDFFEQVGLAFRDPSVNALQCGVRIRNRHKLLPLLQDVEFVAFSWIVQWVRDKTSGAVALGGNGQFVRADCLEMLLPQGPWAPTALTEDLEISIRLHTLNGRIRFLDRHVSQEGVETWKALLKQRHRWAWGTLQVFSLYVASGALWRSSMPLFKKLDLHYYLTFWIVPFIVMASWGLALLSLLGYVRVSNHFETGLLLANSFSFWPTMALALYKLGTPRWSIPALVVLGTLYSYHWIPLLVWAWLDVLRRRKPHWLKTQRIYS